MIYTRPTQVKIINEYVINTLKSHKKGIKVGDIVTVEAIGGSYNIYELDNLKGGWNCSFVENKKYFDPNINLDWRELI